MSTLRAYGFDKEIVNNFHKLRKDKYHNLFRISSSIWFEDSIWDFQHLNKYNRAKLMYVYNFGRIPPNYRLYVKTMMLNEILIDKNEFGTIHKKFVLVAHITSYLHKHEVKEAWMLNLSVVKSFFEEKKEYCTNNYIEVLKVAYIKFISAIEDIDNINLQLIKNYLKEIGDDCYKAKSTTAKNDYIPNEFLNQIVSFALQDLEDKQVSRGDRIISALVIILAETGLRIEELSMLETNKLREVAIGEKKHHYLEFKTFKIESKDTITWLSSKAAKAYQIAEKLVDEIIDSLSESTKMRVFLTLNNNKPFKRRVHMNELNELISCIDEEELKKLDRQARQYLWISDKYGLKKHGTTVLRENIQRFFIRHNNKFDVSVVPKQSQRKIKTLTINSKTKYAKIFNSEERKKAPFEENKEKSYWYVNPHMFRVTVCTKLFMQGIHLDFIVKHMNHLSEDMTVYYNKSQEFEDQLEESINILASISNEEGYIETDPSKIQDEFLKSELENEKKHKNIVRINDFLEANHFNVKNDVKNIIRLLKQTNSPLIENDFGVCIRSVIHGICERRKYFSSTSDYYHIGIQLPTFKFIHHSYERFEQKRRIVEHNASLAASNSKYKSEYEREIKALTYFIKKTLKEEVRLLDEYIMIHGKKNVSENYPDIKHIVDKLPLIKKEIDEWIV